MHRRTIPDFPKLQATEYGLPWRSLFGARIGAEPTAPLAGEQPATNVGQQSTHFPYLHLAAALVVGFCLRLFFIDFRPFYSSDTKFYEELARNWLYHGVYGLYINSHLIPVHMRAPGYPAFLAAIYAVFGQSRSAVMVSQAVLDLVTCLLTVQIAVKLSLVSSRAPVATIALWMAVLCPFTANYTAAILTETLATFLTTAALLILVSIFTDPSFEIPPGALGRRRLLSRSARWLLAGFVGGLGTLVRPETPLLLIATGLVLIFRWRRAADWSKLALAGLWMLAGLLLPLGTWAARNARTVGRVEFVAPRYAESYGDYVPRGYFAWTGTWMVSFRDAYLVTWKLGNAPILVDNLPRSAFDSNSERARVASLLAQYNSTWKIPPLLDREFALLAQQRAAEHPLRSYLFIPLVRAWRIWFTPRIELLPYSGKIWPPGEMRRSSPTDFDVTAALGILNIVFIALACAGAWKCRHDPVLFLLLAVLVVRTAFATQLQTVEPRYVIECYPVIVALGALAWTKSSNVARIQVARDSIRMRRAGSTLPKGR